MHTETLDLREVLVFLAAAGLIVPLMQRLRINPVIGFLAVGCVISPSGIGRFLEPVPYLSAIVISDVEGVRGLAELGVVFTGDTLFQGGPGATGRSYSDYDTLVGSIRSKLFALPRDTIVHTGHGPSTTIGGELF